MLASSLRARDFMQADVITVGPDTPLLDIHRMFVAEEIHGAPVVDDSGAVLGVISTLDLMRAVSEEAEPKGRAVPYFHGEPWLLPDELPEQLAELTAGDIMSRDLVSVSPDLPIADVAQTMRGHHVHRVLVIDDRDLVGVLTTFDLLRAFVRDDHAARPLDGHSS